MEDVRKVGNLGSLATCGALVANFPEGIALLDRAWTVTACNDAYLQLTGGHVAVAGITGTPPLAR